MNILFKNIVKKRSSSSSILGLFIALIFFLTPYISKAETHVSSQDLLHGAVWNKDGSPYILDESPYLPPQYSLHIGKGVTVISASTTLLSPEPNSLNIDGSMVVQGSKEEPVVLSGLGYMYMNHGYIDIKYAVLDGTGLFLSQSTTTIEQTTIKNMSQAINARGSNVKVLDSRLVNNKIGIGSYTHFNFLLMKEQIEKISPYIGGIGDEKTEVALEIVDPGQNIISIHNSSITNNSEYGVLEQSVNTIDATDNWWGDIEGPWQYIGAKGDKAEGKVSVVPWLVKDPDITGECCSNVLFLPGIESSRLYKDRVGLLGESTNTLWEPNRNADVVKMYLDKKGKSIDPDIYTSDIVDSALGLKPIYKSFITMMNGMVADGSINTWLPFPYDWRMSIDDIVNKQTKLGTTSVSLVESIENLAKSSETGKVIIVAHSNGGLVAKVLLQALEKKGISNIVEKLVSVAVPELGTPQAILSLLHGYKQSILGGLILTENNARIFSQNMPGAYGLLPSKKFFEKGPIKMISDMFSDKSGLLASTYDSVKKFLLGNAFSKESSTDTSIPLLLNSDLLSSAEIIHSSVDSWIASSTTKTISYIGWGLPTIAGIEYDKDKHCNMPNESKCDVAFSPIATSTGDGTVLARSNTETANIISYFNLKELNKDTKAGINHASILESRELLGVIKGEIKEQATNDSSTKLSDNKYFSSTEPIDTDKYLTIKIYSPVDIDIYDNEGNHTGPIENPQIGKDFDSSENNIPGSYYGDFGRIKMVMVPYDKYQISLRGNDVGVFSADAKVTQGGIEIASTTFDEFPVTPLMNAEFVIATSTESFSTSTVMLIDTDGDGESDIVNHSNEFFISTTTKPFENIMAYIESIKRVILSLKLKKEEEKKWLNRLDRIVNTMNKKHPRKNVEKIIKKIYNKKYNNKKLDEKKKQTILRIFEELLTKIESQI